MVKYITYYVTHDRRHVLSGRSDQVNRGNWPIGQAQDCKLCQVSSILTLPSLRFDPLPNVLHPQMDNKRELPIDKWSHTRQMPEWWNWNTRRPQNPSIESSSLSLGTNQSQLIVKQRGLTRRTDTKTGSNYLLLTHKWWCTGFVTQNRVGSIPSRSSAVI